MFSFTCHSFCVRMCFPQHYHQDSNYITILFIITAFSGHFILGNENCYHGNQLIAVLIPCYNTAETVFVYDPFHKIIYLL